MINYAATLAALEQKRERQTRAVTATQEQIDAMRALQRYQEELEKEAAGKTIPPKR